MASIKKIELKSGESRYRARYRDREGKEHARHFKLMKDAQRWLDEVTASVVTGTYVDPKASRGTVAAMSKTWLASRPDWTASTRERNRSIVKKYIVPRWGTVRLADVTHEAVQEWASSISLAGGTVRKIVGVLSGILELAVKTKKLAVNPVRGVNLPKQAIKRRRYLTGVEVERLADAAGNQRDIVLVLAYCGLRWGELAALRVRSVDEVRRRLTIDEAMTEIKGKATWDTPKDHQRRTVPYPAFLQGPISERVKGKEPDDLLFTSMTGGLLRNRNARRDWFDAAAKAAGVEGLTPHELRHTAASLAVQAGASVLALQKMLGHEKASVTLDVYADLYDEDLDVLAEQLATARSRNLADFLRTRPALVDPA